MKTKFRWKESRRKCNNESRRLGTLLPLTTTLSGKKKKEKKLLIRKWKKSIILDAAGNLMSLQRVYSQPKRVAPKKNVTYKCEKGKRVKGGGPLCARASTAKPVGSFCGLSCQFFVDRFSSHVICTNVGNPFVHHNSASTHSILARNFSSVFSQSPKWLPPLNGVRYLNEGGSQSWNRGVEGWYNSI